MTQTLRVRMMTSLVTPWGRTLDIGDVIDLSEPEAASLVRGGYAVYVDRKKVERATVDPLEKGTGPAQRSQQRRRGGWT
jgi:hypothetical protein